MESVAVPVVSLASGDEAGGPEAALASVLDHALGTTGFVALCGHGVPERLVDDLLRRSIAFFDRAERDTPPTTAVAQKGLAYVPFKAEDLRAAPAAAAEPDAKASFRYGPYVEGRPWPEWAVGLRQAADAYFVAMSELATRVRRVLAAALQLHHDYFEPFFTEHASVLRVIDYPPVAGSAVQRAGEHTDYGFCTLLRAPPEVGGLQLLARTRTWTDLVPPPNSFILNVGDLLAHWTNKRWVSTPHRVIAGAHARRRRNSIAFFHNPNAEAVVEPAATLQRGDTLPPVVAGPYISGRLAAARR